MSKPAKTTTIGYRDVLNQLWMVEPVPDWLPTRRPLARLAQTPKHHLADRALAAAILGVDADGLLGDPGLRGHLMESLVTLSVWVYARRRRACPPPPDSRRRHGSSTRLQNDTLLRNM